MQGNFKLTGKSIIENQNMIQNHNMSLSLRSQSKDGTSTNKRNFILDN